METPALHLPGPVQSVLQALEKAGFEAAVVGGAVRDALRGEAPGDWDVATSARPAQVQAALSGWRVEGTGLRHGTVTAVVDGMPVEVTTYREDGAYSDHRRPDEVRFTGSLAEDLARRDFTINAMAWSPRRGLVDPFGGRADLARGLVRCVGEPARRFSEDALRILRALRFAAVYDMQIEPATEAALDAHKALLRAVSAERVQAELAKLLCGKAAGRVLTQYAGVLAAVLPEVRPMFGFDQKNPHHDRDVWAHTAAVVDGVPPRPALRWAALLHDSGKPACFSQDAQGVGHFYGHAEKSVAIAQGVLERLRFSHALRGEVLALVQRHDAPLVPQSRAVRRLLRRMGEAGARDLIALHEADALGQAPSSRARLETYRQVRDILDELVAQNACFSLRSLAVNGRDMLALGLEGPQIGKALAACLDEVTGERLPNERAALLRFARGRAEEEAFS